MIPHICAGSGWPGGVEPRILTMPVWPLWAWTGWGVCANWWWIYFQKVDSKLLVRVLFFFGLARVSWWWYLPLPTALFALIETWHIASTVPFSVLGEIGYTVRAWETIFSSKEIKILNKLKNQTNSTLPFKFHLQPMDVKAHWSTDWWLRSFCRPGRRRVVPHPLSRQKCPSFRNMKPRRGPRETEETHCQVVLYGGNT